LLQLIPPTPQGKGKGSRAKIEDARDLIISFYKVALNIILIYFYYLIFYLYEFYIADWNTISINFRYLET